MIRVSFHGRGVHICDSGASSRALWPIRMLRIRTIGNLEFCESTSSGENSPTTNINMCLGPARDLEIGLPAAGKNTAHKTCASVQHPRNSGFLVRIGRIPARAGLGDHRPAGLR